MKTPRMIRRVSCGVATVLVAGLALVGPGTASASVAPAEKGAYTTIRIQSGAGIGAQAKSAMGLITTRAPLPATHQPGAYILCELGSPLGIRSTGVNLEAEFRMACRWTDDRTPAQEVALNEVDCAIRESATGAPNLGLARQPGGGPNGGCLTATPLAPLFGTYRGVVQALVYLSGDPTGYVSPVYYTANSVTVV
ncbi:hypothetical protein AB0J55_12625 [Amycolatopsis sp. NPDC049688]|uniref:hypothetical protein n=1 Tax=Amycolatopsis sp. NPDC049688 TaxID=3154733 RepID=UPI003419597A